MLKIYYTAIQQLPPPEIVQAKLHTLPQQMQDKITAYKAPFEKALQLSSKLLLEELLRASWVDSEVGLDEIEISKTGKPLFNKPLYFSSARSGNIAVTVATDRGDVGIDIEKITLVDIDIYRGYFTVPEWDYITKSQNPTESFFCLWTKKEAVVKAAGTGFFTSLASFDVLNKQCTVNNVTYKLSKVPLQEGYVCHVACTADGEIIEILKRDVFKE